MASSSPRPLLVDLARRYGGAEVRVLQLAAAFGPQRCHVACLKGSPLAERLKQNGFEPFEFAGGKANPGLGRFLARALRSGRCDIVDAHNIQSQCWTAAVRTGMPASAAIPVVATVHSSVRMEHPNSWKGWLYETLERLALRRFDHVITVSQFLLAELLGFGIPQNLTSLVSNGTEGRVLSPAQQAASRQQVRRELGISTDAPLIGAVGRLEPAKGFDVLLPAVSLLRASHPDMKCVIVGSGSQESVLKADARSRGLSDAVIFTGFRSDIHQLLAALDVFVLPSRTEGIPYALLEACAAARPIVASRVGGVPEVIEDGQTGQLVEPELPDALANAVDLLLRDHALAACLGERAAERASARFSMRSMIEGVCLAYEAAARQKASRTR